MFCPYIIDRETEAQERQLAQRSQLVWGRAGIRTQVLWIGGQGVLKLCVTPSVQPTEGRTDGERQDLNTHVGIFFNETHQGVISVQCTISVWRVHVDEIDGAYAVKPLSCSDTEHSQPPETSLVPLFGPLLPLPLAPGHHWCVSKHEVSIN